MKEAMDFINPYLKKEILMSEEQKIETETNQDSKPNTLKSIMLSVLDYIINIVKLPFTVFAKFFTREIIKAIKKDVKTLVFSLLLIVSLLIISAIIWLFLAVAVGVYFYDKGNTILISIGYSLIFQSISLLLFSLILYITSKRLRSLKLIKSILKLEN